MVGMKEEILWGGIFSQIWIYRVKKNRNGISWDLERSSFSLNDPKWFSWNKCLMFILVPGNSCISGYI